MEADESYKIIRTISELKPEYSELLELARQSIRLSYAPYSGFLVGASILLDNGKIITGANQENASFSLSMCAERVALYVKSMTQPEAPIRAMAIFAKSLRQKLEYPAAPCGACRQVIQEYISRQDNDIEIYMQSDSGPIYHFECFARLFPLGFKPDYLLDL